jgi:RNA polymerase sigma-54 factor
MSKTSLELKVSGSINVTQDLKLYINMLQMNAAELLTFLDNQIECNPFLEIEEKEEEFYNKNNYEYKSISTIEDFSLFESKQNIYDIINEQIYFHFQEKKYQQIAFYIMQLMDDRGLINTDEIEQYKNDSDFIYVLNKMKYFEPNGIFAENIKECLKIQAKIYRNSLYDILIDNLEIVASYDYSKLTKIINVTKDEVMLMIKNIQKLNPSPIAKYSNDKLIPKIPDVFIEEDVGNSFFIEINRSLFPKLQIKDIEIDDKTTNSDDKKFIQTNLYQAKGLAKALENREIILLKIASAILKFQKKFFRYGIMHLMPMTISDIAKETLLHESTISRATTGKYIECKYGIFELKYFFSSKITSSLEEFVSSKKIQELIKSMISDEKEEILSDEQIMQNLHLLKINIARRTVAKYRKILKIPSSAARKKANFF